MEPLQRKSPNAMKIRLCAKCKNHGIESPIRDKHVNYCCFRNCPCSGCARISRNRAMCAAATRRRRARNQGKKKDGAPSPDRRVWFVPSERLDPPNIRVVPWYDLITLAPGFIGANAHALQRTGSVLDVPSLSVPTFYGNRDPPVGLPSAYGSRVAPHGVAGIPMAKSIPYGDVNVGHAYQGQLNAHHMCLNETSSSVWQVQDQFVGKTSPMSTSPTVSIDQLRYQTDWQSFHSASQKSEWDNEYVTGMTDMRKD